MKKFISAILAVAIMLSGCSGIGTPKASVGNVVMNNEVTGEITVSCYDTMTYQGFLTDAAKRFEEKYPGTKVNIETFSAMPEIKTMEENGKYMAAISMEDDTQAKSDYINKISTELMSGKGADILALDVLPFYKYAANDQLDNLNEYMDSDPDFNKSNYRTNLFDALSGSKGQYIMPLDYSFLSIAYDSSLFTENQQEPLKAAEKVSYEELMDMGTEAFNSHKNDGDPIYMFGLNETSLFSALFSQNYTSFIDIDSKKANFTDGKFTSLLNSIKEYANEGLIKPGSGFTTVIAPGKTSGMAGGAKIGSAGGANAGGDGPVSISEASEMFVKDTTERFFYKSQLSGTLLQSYNKNSMMRMMTPGMGNTDNDELSGMISNSNGEVSFTYSQAYGINSNSNNKRTAWEFIKFLLSDEIQVSLGINGLPINKNAFLTKTKMSITGELYANGRSMFGGVDMKPKENAPEIEFATELDEDGQKIFDAYVAQVEKYTKQINAFFIQDSSIENTVLTEITGFFDGIKSADEVADVLQSRISLYLNE